MTSSAWCWSHSPNLSGLLLSRSRMHRLMAISLSTSWTRCQSCISSLPCSVSSSCLRRSTCCWQEWNLPRSNHPAICLLAQLWSWVLASSEFWTCWSILGLLKNWHNPRILASSANSGCEGCLAAQSHGSFQIHESVFQKAHLCQFHGQGRWRRLLACWMHCASLSARYLSMSSISIWTLYRPFRSLFHHTWDSSWSTFSLLVHSSFQFCLVHKRSQLSVRRRSPFELASRRGLAHWRPNWIAGSARVVTRRDLAKAWEVQDKLS